MKFTLCSSSSELRCPFVEGLPQCINKNMLAPGLPVKVDNFVKENAQASNHDTRKLVMSSNLMPRRIKESRLGKKQLEEPGRKLEYVRTLLIDNYDSYTYNIYQELSVINGLPPVVVRNDELSWKDVCHYLYEENAFDNIVISPGPGSPTCPADIGQKQKQEVQLSCLFCRADNLNFVPKEKYISSMVQGCNDAWHHLHDEKDVQSINFCPFAQFVGSIGICLQVLLDCWNVPILGVCLGHQALGYVHGAKVVHASEPVHGRLSEIQHNGCVLFNDIPSGHNSGFKVVRYHSLVIDAESLPDELIPIAWTSSVNALSFIETKESNVASKSTDASFSMKHNFFTYSPSSHSGKVQSERVLMGIMHSSRPHYGVQFHPESIATCHGRQIFKNFRKITENYWLRSSASLIDAQNYPFTARMQMPHVGHLLTDVPKHRQLLNNADGHLYKDADNVSCSGMVDMVNLLHPSITVKDLRLKWKKLKHLAGQVGGARNIFCELYGQEKAENTFWLDSSSIEKRRARFSFMGGKGGALWKQVTFKLSDKSDTTLKGRGLLSVQGAQGSIKRSFLEEGFLDFLKKELLSFCYDEKEYEELPFDFHGGYIGYLGYNLKVECGVDSNRHRSQTPDACFFFADNLVVVDHRNDDVYILSVDEVCTPLTPWLDDTEQKLLNLKASATGEGKKRTLTALRSLSGQGTFLGDKSREAYIEDVDKCLEYIKDGESYELCLTTQMRKRIGDIDCLGLYLHLREKNPAPYAAWLNFSDEDLSICCSSPERFLQLDRNGVLEAKPIKGTVARGATPEEDEQRKLQLQYSEKDQAENLMIVDLLRNDLGRVCEPGSVHVPRLMDVESYATVHTMVSTIRGQKRSDMTAIDCVRAAFPGGSMTGAPKLRSMELLDSIESSSRGIYSGSIGFFSYNQTFDLNIVIRTVVIHKGEASIGAGGAIVALSNPEDEYEEMVLKTRAPAKAVLEFL